MTATLVVFYLLLLAANIAGIVVCFQKGKPWFGVLGLLVSPIFTICGACRIAKPGSSWYAKYEHEPWKIETAKVRFPKEAHVQAALNARVSEPAIEQLATS